MINNLENVNEQHVTYALLISLVEELGGVVKMSKNDILKIVSEKNFKLDLYEVQDDIFLEVVEDESQA